MKAYVLVKNGPPEKAFALKNLPDPEPKDGELLIQSEGFGLNFADIMARKGLYDDCPPLPTTIGYDAVGTVTEVGKGIESDWVGKRVVVFTRFGGYAEKISTSAFGAAVIPADMPLGVGTALAAQYCTAYYAACEMVNILPGDIVLIHNASGGVGTALIQLCKWKGARIIGTASPGKHDYLKSIGVDIIIDYRTKDFETEIEAMGLLKKIDVIFDPIGGRSVSKGMKLLNSSGRMVLYGASQLTEAKNLFQKAGVGIGFGIWSPIQLLQKSISVIGVNMLRVADHKPIHLHHCLNQVVRLANEGILKPTVGKVFENGDVVGAHKYLEERKSIGKVAVKW